MDNEVKDDRPDSEKTNEELQREILLAQKRKLEEEERKRANKWKPTPANIALIVFFVVVALWIGSCIYDAVDDKIQRDKNEKALYDAILNDSASDEFLETLPMVN